ncbi:HSF-type DNA-binding-domain-containing protein [Cokeromyces recurvatus]|uniref:HSF-type DNA-binding-domain-containing protein n=1 Tax=Cokeromyces recurvatus TaxID=90255 RepID=UPI0022210B5E|nr:HSF-type DNA-binding-domain-containing protein [Cokeromyces recurvatus]XP_051380194.1 HSF-type DNA-binding-domain-containing protein [Cokeromyces recurvatus]KAI7899075.1 HSF-type DNA-binding-domain-containing protein [Cokeromyces recurvatus]KAI7900209.1 HSF-type DNA-binding-domain-containing protein [Cokeromyces recurvatus]
MNNMNDGHTPSAASLGINTNFSGSSVSSGGSPLNSPLISPGAGSPSYDNPVWDQLHSQFIQQMSLQPPSRSQSNSTKPGGGNTFVHKLYNMVVDKQYQHLIAWTYTGTSFIVCNITEFSRDVLPKHFKHNNFSSFVRQLNMYGFHKVNKSPRGHRTLAENQIWEFSHPKFLRNRPDLLDEIKRKALESDSVRRDNTDITSHLTMMQMSQSDMMQQISHLQSNLSQVMNELSETKKKQQLQQQMIKDMIDFMTKQYGSTLPLQTLDIFDSDKQGADRPPPPIFITSADNQHHQQQQQHQFYLNTANHHPSPTSSSNSPLSSPQLDPTDNLPQLTIQTQKLKPLSQPASPRQYFSSEENNTSLYNPKSPLLSQNTYICNNQNEQQPF